MFPPSRLSQCYMEPMGVGRRDDPPWARPACFCSARSMPLKPYCTCHAWPWPACCHRGALNNRVSSLQTPDLMDLVFKNVTVFIHPISVFLFAKNENIHHMLFYNIIFNLMIYCERLFMPKKLRTLTSLSLFSMSSITFGGPVFLQIHKRVNFAFGHWTFSLVPTQ